MNLVLNLSNDESNVQKCRQEMKLDERVNMKNEDV